MIEKILTDNAGEKITIRWDGTRFAIVHQTKVAGYTKGIILNPREMLSLIEFAGKLGGE